MNVPVLAALKVPLVIKSFIPPWKNWILFMMLNFIFYKYYFKRRLNFISRLSGKRHFKFLNPWKNLPQNKKIWLNSKNLHCQNICTSGCNHRGTLCICALNFSWHCPSQSGLTSKGKQFIVMISLIYFNAHLQLQLDKYIVLTPGYCLPSILHVHCFGHTCGRMWWFHKI